MCNSISKMVSLHITLRRENVIFATLLVFGEGLKMTCYRA